MNEFREKDRQTGSVLRGKKDRMKAMEHQEIIWKNLEIFSKAVNIHVKLLSTDGTETASFGEPCAYCDIFRQATGKYCPCKESHGHACVQATALGEGYVFSCPAGLVHFAASVFHGHIHSATVLAGPIILDYPDISVVDDVMRGYDLALVYRPRLYAALSQVPLVPPEQAEYLSKLLFLLMSNLTFRQSETLEAISEKACQQAKIGEYIHLIKGAGTDAGNRDDSSLKSQYDLEQLLLSDVLSGNETGAREVLNEMLGRIYFTSGNNVEIIKTRSVELVAFLSRALIENGTDENLLYHLTDSYFRKLTSCKDITDLSYLILIILKQFTNLAFADKSRTGLPVIKKAISYMTDHYNQNPGLNEVASEVGLNPTYFSTLFKQKTGKNFSAYLTDLKIANAKLLLKDTNLSISSIAAELGFVSQSHFSEAFRKGSGVTPRRYRDQGEN